MPRSPHDDVRRRYAGGLTECSALLLVVRPGGSAVGFESMLHGMISWRRDLVVLHAADLIRLAGRYDAGAIYLTGSVARGEERDDPAPGKPEPSDVDFYTPEWHDDPATNEERAQALLAGVRALLPRTKVDIRPMGPGWPIDGAYQEGFRRDAIPLTAFLG
jgi:hypothetical protein